MQLVLISRPQQRPSTVRRDSQELPFGGRLQGEELVRVREATLTALRFASLPRRLTFDGEAHVVRLAAIYATPDCAEQIAPPQLEAALASSNRCVRAIENESPQRHS